jgi:hypothetical protein
VTVHHDSFPFEGRHWRFMEPRGTAENLGDLPTSPRAGRLKEEDDDGTIGEFQSVVKGLGTQ